jgi:hypothetical protein
MKILLLPLALVATVHGKGETFVTGLHHHYPTNNKNDAQPSP